MIYLCAQPDDLYFHWQIELLISNLFKLNVNKLEIHILIGYDLNKGLNPIFEELSQKHDDKACFFFYPDLRKSKNYKSSIRPNIIKQHYAYNKYLESEAIFYHDSDILFLRLPIFNEELTNNVCYVADTRSYMGLSYIESTSNEKLLHEMLDLVGLSKDSFLKEEQYSGGAQYLLKNIKHSFWEKVEQDCENLYFLLKTHNDNTWESNYSTSKIVRSKHQGIDEWLSDMWSVLWNLWLEKKNIRQHSELDFVWANSPIIEAETKTILHYTGVNDSNYSFFDKGLYTHTAPYFDFHLQRIPTESCSKIIVEAIMEMKNSMLINLPYFDNKCLVIYSFSIIEERNHLLYKTLNAFIKKTININIFFYCPSSNQIENEYILKNVESIKEYVYNIYNEVIWFPLDFIVSPQILLELLKKELCKDIEVIYPNRKYILDNIFYSTFNQLLDIDILDSNIGKFQTNYSTKDTPIVVCCTDNKDVLEYVMQLINKQINPSQYSNIPIEYVYTI